MFTNKQLIELKDCLSNCFCSLSQLDESDEAIDYDSSVCDEILITLSDIDFLLESLKSSATIYPVKDNDFSLNEYHFYYSKYEILLAICRNSID